MKYIYLILFLIFVAFKASTAQKISRSKSKAYKQKTVRVSTIIQVEDSIPKFKDPNRHWSPPTWSYDEDNIIYRQPLSEISNHPAKVLETSPAPDTSFVGLLDDGTSIPPDVNGAAGPNHLMETLNTEVRISDKNGNELFTTTLSSFWSSLPGSSSTFDPKIVYDPYAERWIMITPSSSSLAANRMFLAVSLTTDPMGEWNMYSFDPDPTNETWFDYPNLGFNKNWISIGGILRDTEFEPIHYVVYSIDKMAAYEGEPELTINHFLTSIGSAIVPSFTYDENQDELYLISTGPGNDDGNGYVNLFKLSGEVNNPDFELLGSVGVPEPWENWSYEYHPDFLPQLDSDEKLNSVDARMHTMINRNDELWAVHHIYLPADNPERVAIQWWHLDTIGTILERGRIDDPDNGFSFAYPSIAVNANEDVFIGHGVFAETQYAGAGYSFKAYYDEPGTLRDFYQYKEGLAPYYKTFSGDRNRWGDYSAVFVDPVIDVNFWAMHEYAEEPSGQSQWGTWVAYYQPSFPPVADFTSDEILIPVGETVDFSDLSLGVPTEWYWEFEGGTPSTSVEQNPADILFDQEGAFDVRLISTNDLGTDTILKEGYIVASYSIVPEVDFYADEYVPCLGDTIRFIDLSKYSPNQWFWEFNPATVTFVNGTTEESQNPEVVFSEAGPYDVSLTALNLNGGSILTKESLINAGGYAPWFKETFEDESFSLENWKIENPDDDITWGWYEVGGNSPGTIAAGIDFSDYFAFSQRDRLISPPINLEGLSSATLQFEHAYASRYPGISDSLIVLISSDCGNNWTRVFAGGEDGSGNFATHQPMDGDFWAETEEDWCLSGWGSDCIWLNLTEWAGMPNLRIAFESYSAFGNPLFVDNVEISQFVGLTDEILKPSVEVYPVPAKEMITVKLPEGKTFSQIRLVDQLGRSVFSAEIELNEQVIEIVRESAWKNGIYILQLSGNNDILAKQIVFY